MPTFAVSFLGRGGFPYKNRLQKKVGTLVLTSVLEGLIVVFWCGASGRVGSVVVFKRNQGHTPSNRGGAPLI